MGYSNPEVDDLIVEAKYAAAHRKVRHVDLHPFKFFTFADTWYLPKKEP